MSGSCLILHADVSSIESWCWLGIITGEDVANLERVSEAFLS
jgi:hypothetical protein